jgi:hypothetical protein
MSLRGALSQHERIRGDMARQTRLPGERRHGEIGTSDTASRPPSPQACAEALAEGDAGLRDRLVPADSRCLLICSD